jgi:hypothetical protein
MSFTYEKDQSGLFYIKLTTIENGLIHTTFGIDENDPDLIQWISEGNTPVNRQALAPVLMDELTSEEIAKRLELGLE